LRGYRLSLRRAEAEHVEIKAEGSGSGTQGTGIHD
jgi:hypothetical protein